MATVELYNRTVLDTCAHAPRLVRTCAHAHTRLSVQDLASRRIGQTPHRAGASAKSPLPAQCQPPRRKDKTAVMAPIP